jgi:hypothetical protein
MQTPKVSLLSPLFLVTSLLAGLFFSGPIAAARPVMLTESPEIIASAGLQQANSTASLLTILEVAVGRRVPLTMLSTSP